MQYEDLRDEYGMMFLQEVDPDSAVYFMDSLGEILDGLDVFTIVKMVAYGGRYDYTVRDEGNVFNPMAEYFAFDGYGNLMSIEEHQIVKYLDECISSNDFENWLRKDLGIEFDGFDGGNYDE